VTASFESDVLAELASLRDEISSLGRAVRGAPEEGNVGIHARIDGLSERGNERHGEVDRRLDGLEGAYLRFRLWGAGAAALGGAVGATVAVILDLRRLVGGP
jgi:hypothetical protein